MLLLCLPAVAISQDGDAAQPARVYLNSGNPEQAIKTARRVLRKLNLPSEDRLALLSLIAKAEIMRVSHQRYEKVSRAIDAIGIVLREFPDSRDSAELRWQLAWTWWKSGNHKQAISAAREIITQDQQANNLRRAWLLMARIHIQQRNFSYARSDLLQYGLQVKHRSRQQATGMAWMSIIDIGEMRHAVAFKNMHTVYNKWPDLIRTDPELFAAYIQLMHQQNNEKETLQLSEIFIGQYIHTDHAAPIRLIHADIRSQQDNRIDDAIQEYGILADKEAETLIGRQAFMRKMMLEFRHKTDRDSLIPVMISLKKIATDNQLSIIEDEAMLDLARLWVRLQENDNVATSKKNQSKAPALQAYAHATISLEPNIAKAAAREGSAWMSQSIEAALAQQQWIKAVSIWRQFPQLRPRKHQSQTLRLGIAHAMRMLMLFEPAETILQTLYSENKFSLRGERTMLELAKLWMDRQDENGVKKIMRWLNRHEFSMYRPEMLLIVARMQLAQKKAEQARQTLSSVRSNDITDASRASYWQSKADISEALSQWHSAARAWGKYRQSKGADAALGLSNQADNLFSAQEFPQALKLYQQMPEEVRDAAWEYHMGISEMRTGASKQGTERLQQLAAIADGGRFTSLAKLALADKQASILLGEKP
ncbi:MAG: tetratricopeptide repeat protein [Mariprofundus sp.]|nr:tetratricopeptide repeat protein [Mariprofundus sp.]